MISRPFISSSSSITSGGMILSTAPFLPAHSQMSFCEWNGDSPGVRLFDVTVFKSSDWEQGKDTDGYSLIYKDNRFAFAFVNHHPDSAMALGDDEIKTAFSLLGKGNAANGKS